MSKFQLNQILETLKNKNWYCISTDKYLEMKKWVKIQKYDGNLVMENGT